MAWVELHVGQGLKRPSSNAGGVHATPEISDWESLASTLILIVLGDRDRCLRSGFRTYTYVVADWVIVFTIANKVNPCNRCVDTINESLVEASTVLQQR